jgi:hypothetical protein
MSSNQKKCPSKTALQKDQAADLSIEEMAEFYGVTPGTVKTWFSNYGISRKAIKVEECHDVNVGDATVVAIDCDDDGVYTYAVPGGGVGDVVVGIAEAERVGAIMNEYWPRRDT